MIKKRNEKELALVLCSRTECDLEILEDYLQSYKQVEKIEHESVLGLFHFLQVEMDYLWIKISEWSSLTEKRLKFPLVEKVAWVELSKTTSNFREIDVILKQIIKLCSKEVDYDLVESLRNCRAFLGLFLYIRVLSLHEKQNKLFSENDPNRN